MFDCESSDSQFGKSLTKTVDFKFEDSFGYYRDIVSELRVEAVLGLGVFTEVEGSSILFCTIGVVGLLRDEKVAWNLCRRFKASNF